MNIYTILPPKDQLLSPLLDTQNKHTHSHTHSFFQVTLHDTYFPTTCLSHLIPH